MGKVSRRLTIVVFPPLGEWSEIVKLEEQGHEIIRVTENTPPMSLLSADLVIGPPCWYFDIKHRKYLTSAIKQARLRRYGAPQRKAGKKDADDEKSSIDFIDSIDNEPFRGQGE